MGIWDGGGAGAWEVGTIPIPGPVSDIFRLQAGSGCCLNFLGVQVVIKWGLCGALGMTRLAQVAGWDHLGF